MSKPGVLRIAACLLAVFLVAGNAPAGEKGLMHCFYFTPQEGATEADFQAFFKATDELPKQIPGLNRVWYGKLLQPRPIFGTNPEISKKLAAGETGVTGPVTRLVREYGVCMEFDDAEALKVYGPHPAHKKWEEVYFKVRRPGTNTFDIVAQ